MSGLWDNPAVPKHGWSCEGIVDLGDLAAVCEMCQAKEIRYVHSMSHRDWPQVLGCGCICAGHMETSVAAARQREVRFRRRQRWLARKWRCSASGNEYLNAMGYRVVVWPSGAAWAAGVTHRTSGWRRLSQRPYATSDAAKLAALDVILARRDSVAQHNAYAGLRSYT